MAQMRRIFYWRIKLAILLIGRRHNVAASGAPPGDVGGTMR